MMPENRRIVLNAGRVHQIERLAQLRETSIAGAVESLVADRVSAGELPAGFPGLLVQRLGDDILLVLDGTRLSPLAAADAARFGQELTVLATRPAGTASIGLVEGAQLTVRRNGRGFSIGAGEARLCVSTSMLREIAAQIMEAAK